MLMNNVKTIGVFVVIFCCFAVLYPKIFHPMVVHIFGMTPPTTERGKDAAGPAKHPRELNPSKPMPQPPRNPTMRPGVHPGMRAAAEMRKQAGDQGGGNKGMINMVLPMYAVGIVIYLVYTMAKVFMRNKKPDEPGPFQSRSDFYRSSSYKDDAGPYFNYPTETMDEETRFLLSKREKLEELEELLAKAELKQINDNEMVTLRERLEETESQMSRILKAMEHVQTRVKDGIDAHLEAKGKGYKRTEEKVGKQRQPFGQENDGADLQEPETVTSTQPQPTPTKAALNTDLNALDSESSGRESDDELSDEEEDERDVHDDSDEDDDLDDEVQNEEEEEEDEGDESDDEDEEEEDVDNDDLDIEKGIKEINGVGSLDADPLDNDVMQHLARHFDAIPDTDSDDALRGDVINDVDSSSDVEHDVDDVIETMGSRRVDMDREYVDDEMDLGVRKRKNVTS